MMVPHTINAPNDIVIALPTKTGKTKKDILALRAIRRVRCCIRHALKTSYGYRHRGS